MKTKVSDYIADYLTNRDITDVFTVTGGGAMHLNDSFGHHPKLRCTYNHHEQACAMAAEGYFRASGRLPLVCVTSGPGGTNAVTGVMGAWVDSIPMLVISGQVKFSTTVKSTELPLRQLGDQEFNITDAVKCMTKYTVMVTEPNMIKYHLDKALHLALSGRGGPVWLDIPLNVQSAVIDTDELREYDLSEDAANLPPDAASEDIAKMLEKIQRAERPVILAGNGIRLGGAYYEFLKVIERLNIPVVTAWGAHDLLWDNHPLYCGRPGSIGTRGGNFVVQNSDCLVSFACRMNIRQISYNYEKFADKAYKIYIDTDKAELMKPTLSVDLPVHADIKDALSKVLETGFTLPPERHKDWLKWCRDIDAKYPADLPRFYEKQSPVNPYVFMKKLSSRFSEEQVTVLSNGSACVCGFQAMSVKKGQRFFTNSGSASMGYGLPAAVGAAVALKNKDIVCLEGDGSIQMNIQELQTAVHNKLNIKIFWLNNDGYHSMRQTQSNLFDSNFCGINADSGISFPSAEKIAYAYGIPFFRADSLDSLVDVFSAAFNTAGIVITEVLLDPSQFFEPKLSAKVMPDGSIISPSLENMSPFLSETEMETNKF